MIQLRTILISQDCFFLFAWLQLYARNWTEFWMKKTKTPAFSGFKTDSIFLQTGFLLFIYILKETFSLTNSFTTSFKEESKQPADHWENKHGLFSSLQDKASEIRDFFTLVRDSYKAHLPLKLFCLILCKKHLSRKIPISLVFSTVRKETAVLTFISTGTWGIQPRTLCTLEEQAMLCKHALF